MSILMVMIPITLILSVGFLFGFIWANKSGQFDDTQTPALRILEDEDIP